MDPTVITARRYSWLKTTHDRSHLIHSVAEARKLAEKIKKKGGSGLVSVRENLVDAVWGKSKPPRPNEKVVVLDAQFSGKTFQEKIEDLRKELDKKKSAGLIICELERSLPRFF